MTRRQIRWSASIVALTATLVGYALGLRYLMSVGVGVGAGSLLGLLIAQTQHLYREKRANKLTKEGELLNAMFLRQMRRLETLREQIRILSLALDEGDELTESDELTDEERNDLRRELAETRRLGEKLRDDLEAGMKRIRDHQRLLVDFLSPEARKAWEDTEE